MFFYTKKGCNLCGKGITHTHTHTHTHTSLCCLLVAGLLGSLITSEALALGGIGGGRSAKARNNNGIQAIHAYVCVNLDCSQSNIKIVEKCATNAHMENGICYCDDGYLGDGETCTESLCSPGQKPDKNNEKCLNCEADEPCATCKNPFTPNGDGKGNCVCSDTSCGTGHYCSAEGTCETWEDGDPTPCTDQKVWDASENKCVRRCTHGKLSDDKESCINCGRWTGLNCEIAPTTCPTSGYGYVYSIIEEDGQCRGQGEAGYSVLCPKEQEIACPSDGGCICYNEGDSVDCGWYTCQSCSNGQIAKCSEGGDCICYNEGDSVDCGWYTCQSCSNDQIAKCSAWGECICYNKEDQVACNLETCVTGKEAKCSGDGTECTAGESVDCGKNQCISCSDGQIAKCSEHGECICYNEEDQVACTDNYCVTGKEVKCVGNVCAGGDTIDCSTRTCQSCSGGQIPKCSKYADCICYNKGEDVACTLYAGCIACSGGQLATCSSDGECICYNEGDSVDCSFLKCFTCSGGQIAKCSDGGECICYNKGEDVACSYNQCISCSDGQIAKCFAWGDCICYNEDEDAKCNWLNCAHCTDGKIATCDRDYGECTCVDGEKLFFSA